MHRLTFDPGQRRVLLLVLINLTIPNLTPVNLESKSGAVFTTLHFLHNLRRIGID
jgi:hypothetical protein